MEKGTNSAIRIDNILRKAYASDKKRILDMWINTFQIDEKNTHSREMAVIECLNNLNNEFELFKQNMQKTNFSENLYSNEINQLQRSLIVPTAINGDWNKSKISDVQFKVLEFCSEILPANDHIIRTEDVEELRKLLNELDEFSKNNSLPNNLNNIIKKHIANIKKALYSYDIMGAEIFDDILQSAYGEVFKNPNLFTESENAELKNKLSAVWIKVQKIYGTAKNIHQFYIDFSNMANTIKDLLPPPN